MPKEIVREHPNSEAFIEVSWNNFPQSEMQICIDRNEPFRFVSDDNDTENEFTGLCMTFDSAESVNRLIKVLHRAKRKTFG